MRRPRDQAPPNANGIVTGPQDMPLSEVTERVKPILALILALGQVTDQVRGWQAPRFWDLRRALASAEGGKFTRMELQMQSGEALWKGFLPVCVRVDAKHSSPSVANVDRLPAMAS